MDTLASSLQGINLPPHQSAHSPRHRWKWHVHLHTSAVRNSDLRKAGEWINGSHPFTAIRYLYLDPSFQVCKNVVPNFLHPQKKNDTKFWQKLYDSS